MLELLELSEEITNSQIRIVMRHSKRRSTGSGDARALVVAGEASLWMIIKLEKLTFEI